MLELLSACTAGTRMALSRNCSGKYRQQMHLAFSIFLVLVSPKTAEWEKNLQRCEMEIILQHSSRWDCQRWWERKWHFNAWESSSRICTKMCYILTRRVPRRVSFRNVTWAPGGWWAITLTGRVCWVKRAG